MTAPCPSQERCAEAFGLGKGERCWNCPAPFILDGERLKIAVSAPPFEPQPVTRQLGDAFRDGTVVEAFGYQWRVSGLELGPRNPPTFTLVCMGPATRPPP